MKMIPETLFGLINRYSPTGQVTSAVNWLASKMMDLSFDQAFVDPVGNIVGLKGSGPRLMVLLGHIDTVAGEIEVRLEADRLFGRGSVDAKGSLAAFIDAVAAVSVEPDWRICVIGAVDEEGASQGAKYVSSQYQPELAIIGEPSQWNRVTLGYKGVQNADLLVSLPMAHSSQGDSANDRLLAAWQTLLQRVNDYNQHKRMFDQILPTVLEMHSHTDGFKTHAKLSVSTRLPKAVSPQNWLDDWLGSLQVVRVAAVGQGLKAFKAGKNTELTRAFIAAIRDAGGDAAYVIKGGTSDLNIVAPVWNCPIVAYGPGVSDLDHTPDEHIHIDDYWQAVQVLKNVLRRLGAAKADE